MRTDLTLSILADSRRLLDLAGGHIRDQNMQQALDLIKTAESELQTLQRILFLPAGATGEPSTGPLVEAELFD